MKKVIDRLNVLQIEVGYNFRECTCCFKWQSEYQYHQECKEHINSKGIKQCSVCWRRYPRCSPCRVSTKNCYACRVLCDSERSNVKDTFTKKIKSNYDNLCALNFKLREELKTKEFLCCSVSVKDFKKSLEKLDDYGFGVLLISQPL